MGVGGSAKIGRGVALTATLLLLGCARTAAPGSLADARAGDVVPSRPAADTQATAERADGSALDSLGTLGRLGLGAAGKMTGKCGEIEDAWQSRLAAGGACERDADCACYTSSLWAPFGAAATDVTTARALGKLARAFATRSCPTVCAQGTPERCQATCREGRCVAVYSAPYARPMRDRSAVVKRAAGPKRTGGPGRR
jgi:hypothetical protein